MTRRRSIRRERGQTMVEFAIILPVFCLLLFGIAQLGIAFNHWLELTDATRVGARKAAVSRTQSNPTQLAKDATKASAGGLNPALTDSQITVTSTWSPGTNVQVCAQYPYDIHLIGMPHVVIFEIHKNLNACTTERVE
jgi:Flp pilus assembly protein TadG